MLSKYIYVVKIDNNFTRERTNPPLPEPTLDLKKPGGAGIHRGIKAPVKPLQKTPRGEKGGGEKRRLAVSSDAGWRSVDVHSAAMAPVRDKTVKTPRRPPLAPPSRGGSVLRVVS